MLYCEERHLQMAAIKWDEAAVRREIEEIVRDTEAAYQPHAWWPLHPRDDYPDNAPPSKTLYAGAAGVMWALEFLAGCNAASVSRSYEKLWHAAWRDCDSIPDTEAAVPSWFIGQSALLLLCMLRGPEAFRAEAADRLYQEVTANIENPTWELLWGSPGTMLAALFAYEKTGEGRWLRLYQRNAERLWEKLSYDDDLDCYLWVQDLYGRKGALYGAGHGFAGNAFALLRGINHLPEDLRRLLISRVTTTTKRLAIRSGGLANWPVRQGAALLPTPPPVVQWCHGAPGFILSLAPHLAAGQDDELDQIFLEAGELIWQAGPLTKGACFCHGTDSNGMALLTLFKRTGDAQWLDRARTFAMQALAQSHQNLKIYGHRRYTLWTGDLGLAVFLQACVDKKPHMPALDFI